MFQSVAWLSLSMMQSSPREAVADPSPREAVADPLPKHLLFGWWSLNYY